MVLVWQISDDSPNLPNFLPTKLSCYTVCYITMMVSYLRIFNTLTIKGKCVHNWNVYTASTSITANGTKVIYVLCKDICDQISQLMGIQTKTHFSALLCGWMHELTMQVCTTANCSSVCFYPGLFLRPV